MSRRKNQPAKAYQRRPNGSSHFNLIYDDMLDSAAFHDLTGDQCKLLLFCIRESHGKAMRDHAQDGGRGDERLFYMNRAQRCRTHGLYPLSDSRRFERDMAALVSHGFVDCLESGLDERKKNLYRLSGRWHHFGTPAFSMPEAFKTRHQINVEGKARMKRLREANSK